MRSSVKSRDIREFFGRAQRSQETPATPSEESLGRELDGDRSRQLVPTSRVDQGLIPVLEDGLVDEDEDLDPIRPVSSTRKRVIPDSGDELEESDGETVLTPAIQEKRQKVEEPEADFEDEDIESKVLAVVEASMEDETPESSSDDEVVDEEYIPSPDDVVDDDNLTAEAIQVAPIQAIAGQRRFVQILYNCLLALKTWADGVDLVGVAREKRPMTLGYWRLLKQLSLELIVSMWLAGISEEVQAFFEKDSWCLDDILSLPFIAGDRRQGIYGDFATGDIIRRKDADNACDAYVGLAGVLFNRIGDHLNLAKRSVDELPKAYKKSLHFRHKKCQDNIVHPLPGKGSAR